MDTNTIYQCFKATYHADPNVRMQAELQLKQLEVQPGFLGVVMQIIGSPDSENAVRQASAIFFKNRIAKSWDSVDREVAKPILEQDRAVIKQNILQAIVQLPHNVRVQLVHCLGTMLSTEYPNNWPEFIPHVQQLLQSGDHTHVFGGLLALLEVVKTYQFKGAKHRGPLVEIVKNMFPGLHTIAMGLLAAEPSNADAGLMLKTVLKIYHVSISFELSKVQQSNDSVIPWGSLFIQTIQKPIPLSTLPSDPSEREKAPWWKAKKWAYQCLNRLFDRYGNPSITKNNAQYAPFAKMFTENFAPEILRAYLKEAEKIIGGEWYTPRCMYLLGVFLTESVKTKVTWNIMKPYFEGIVSHFIFPLMCFSKEDEELWEDDQIEYIHKKVDPFEDFRSPGTAVMELLHTLAHDRLKTTLVPILTFVNSVLTNPESGPNQKDGALHMISTLVDVVLKKKSPVRDQMEHFLMTFVLPQFSAPQGFLRARACDVMFKFQNLEFKDRSIHIRMFQSTLSCLKDSEMPVKVEAALALQVFMEDEEMREMLKPHVAGIMQELLKMTNELDMDTLTHVMELFVEVFADEVKPFAVELAMSLRDTFLRVMAEAYAAVEMENMDDSMLDEASDKTMAAMGVLKTLGTLIVSVEHAKEILAQLEEIVHPICVFVLEKNIIDLYDEVFETIDSLTYSSKHVSPLMWSLFEYVYKAFKTDAIDYMEELTPCLDNYVSFGTDVVISNEQVRNCFVDIITTVFTAGNLSENDRSHACALIESMMLNCRGQIDTVVPHFLELAVKYLSKKVKHDAARIYLLEVIINGIYYNPILTLQFLETHAFTAKFFSLWFENIEQFTRVHDKKLAILALCSLVEIPAAHIPASVRTGWQQIMKTFCELFEGLPDAMEERARLKRMAEGDDDEDDEDEDDDDEDGMFGEGDDEDDDDDIEDDFTGSTDPTSAEVSDSEDVPDKEGDAYLEYLSQQAAAANGAEETDSDGEYMFSYGGDELQEDPYLETPLDKMDPYIVFRKTMADLSQTQPESYRVLMSAVSAKNSKVLAEVEKKAEENAIAAMNAAEKKV